MRRTFLSTLADLAEHDSRIMLLTGDLGFMAIEPFTSRFPERFYNVGVAEQNMVGIATGLAEAGFLPFVYSIVTFATLRPYEFIRNGPIMHQFPVRIIGVGGGVEYGHNGLTHYGLEDVGVMRTQPGIAIIAPADYEQTRTALQATWNLPGPIYYRLGKDDRVQVPDLAGQFALGRVQMVRAGTDVLLLAMGGIASDVVAAADCLYEQHGLSCSVALVASVAPPPVADLVALLAGTQLAFTVEAHYTVGGLGSLVAEVVADYGLACRIVRRGFTAMPDGMSGSQHYMQHCNGLSRQALVETIAREMQSVSL